MYVQTYKPKDTVIPIHRTLPSFPVEKHGKRHSKSLGPELHILLLCSLLFSLSLPFFP
jgi:hypothetical protein